MIRARALGGLFSVALAQGALAQVTSIYSEVSSDGGTNWSSGVSVVPGAVVQVRTRVQLTGATAIGLAGLTFQPTLSNWRFDLGDRHIGFTFPGLSNSVLNGTFGQPTTETSYQGNHVLDLPENTGRMFPYGGVAMNSQSASGLLRSFNDPGNVLRFAGANATFVYPWGTGYAPQGITISQRTANEIGTSYNTSLNVVVFRYAITLSASTIARSLVADIPLFGVNNQGVYWYQDSVGHAFQTQLDGTSFTPATIQVVPGAGSVSLMGLLSITLAARRKRPQSSAIRRPRSSASDSRPERAGRS